MYCVRIDPLSEIHSTTNESFYASRTFWHSLLTEMGFDPFVSRCSVKRITTDTVDFIRITVKAA